MVNHGNHTPCGFQRNNKTKVQLFSRSFRAYCLDTDVDYTVATGYLERGQIPQIGVLQYAARSNW